MLIMKICDYLFSGLLYSLTFAAVLKNKRYETNNYFRIMHERADALRLQISQCR